METNTSENFLGSIKNMWDESWQKIDDFFGGRNVMSSNKNLKPFSKRLYLTNVTYDLVIQPPTAWSYCEPYCGVDDQGVDMESANDTLYADVTESISDAFRNVLHVEPPSKNNLKIIFEPQNILGMGFGDFYDRKGQKYIMSRGTVTNVLTRGQVTQKKFTQPLIITFLTRHKMKEIKWENLGYVITERIKKFQKGFLLSERIKVIVEDI
uniref:Phage protein n=1 Tax=Strongyloides papillosus TaxID=174720 RepID=A0A0N5BC61_STREA